MVASKYCQVKEEARCLQRTRHKSEEGTLDSLMWLNLIIGRNHGRSESRKVDKDQVVKLSASAEKSGGWSKCERTVMATRHKAD